MAVLPEEVEDNSPQAELARSNAGSSEAEAAQRRAGMRDNAIEGGGEGDGTPRGNLRSAGADSQPGGPSADAAATGRFAQAQKGSGGGLPGAGGASSSPGGGLGGRLAASFNGAKKHRKRIAGIAGGGLATILVTAVIFFGTAELKLISFMHDMESHYLDRTHYTYEKRSDAWIKDAINSRYFAKDGDKINVQGLPFKEQILQSLGYGIYSDLTANGGKLTVTNGAHSGERIITVTHLDGTETTYSTYQEKGAARSEIGLFVDEQADGENWLKRKWIKHRITAITGTKWHWLDPVTQPLNKAKIAAANQVVEYLLSSSSTATNLAADLLDQLLDSDQQRVVGDALQNASSDETSEILSKALVEELGSASNGVGAAIAFIGLDCGINHVVEDGTLVKIAQAKAEIEYMTEAASWQSRESQLENGHTNGTAVAANMNLLTSDPGPDGKEHDVFESNDVQRAAGNPVPYQPTNDCSSTAELCQSKLPSNALNQTAIGGALQEATDTANSPEYKVIATLIPGAPGSVTTDALCGVYGTAIKPILGLSSSLIDTVASNTPIIDGLWGDMKTAGADLSQKLLDNVVAPVIPPVVDGGTKGPALGSAVGVGLDLEQASEMGSDVGQESTSGSMPCYQKSATDQATDESMCAAPLTPGEAVALNTDMEQADVDEFKSSSMLTQLASIDTPYSALSRVVAAVPASPTLMADDIGGGMMAAINPHSWIQAVIALPSILTAKAHAGGPTDASTYIVTDNGSGIATDQYKVDQYGFTEAQLNSPAGSLPNADRNVGCSLTANYRLKDPNEDVTECDGFESAGSGSAPPPTAASPPPPPAAGGVTISGTRADWVKAIKADSKITFVYDSVESDLDNTQPEGGVVDNTVALLYELGQQGFTVPVTVLRTGHSIDGDGDGLHNPAGAAFDVGYYPGNAEGTQIYEWVYNNRQALHINMMIWDLPPPGYQCIGNGQPVDCLSFFGASTLAEHDNHIHLGVYKQ